MCTLLLKRHFKGIIKIECTNYKWTDVVLTSDLDRKIYNMKPTWKPIFTTRYKTRQDSVYHIGKQSRTTIVKKWFWEQGGLIV